MLQEGAQIPIDRRFPAQIEPRCCFLRFASLNSHSWLPSWSMSSWSMLRLPPFVIIQAPLLAASAPIHHQKLELNLYVDTKPLSLNAAPSFRYPASLDDLLGSGGNQKSVCSIGRLFWYALRALLALALSSCSFCIPGVCAYARIVVLAPVRGPSV